MEFAAWSQKYRKRKAIGAYVTRLRPVLMRLFGKSDHYTPEQVKQAAQEARLPERDLCYGLATYCNQGDFDDYHASSGEECSYWEMRVEVAEHHFHGNTSFTQQDVAAHSEAHSHTGGDFGGGHHFGGDGSGHHGGH
jgi:hypothetical protein